MRRVFGIVFILFFWCASIKGQQFTSPAEAFSKAAEMHRPVLLVFSGSDWCLPCIRLQKKIFSDIDFKEYADSNLVILTADFPQQNKLPVHQVKWNEELAALYNPTGSFPLLLLLRADRSIVTSLRFDNYTTETFINQVKEALKTAGMAKEYSHREKLMGSAFEFIVIAENKQTGNILLEECVAEVKRIEKKLSEFTADSETSLINKNASELPVEVSGETYSLIQRCKDISRLTNGAFDISSGTLKKLYDFKRGNGKLPSPEKINEQLQKTGYQKIKLLNGNRIAFEQQGMHIAFGAIGKGYAADKVKTLMKQKGVSGGVINASGDLSAWGTRVDGQPWKTGIVDPSDRSSILCWLFISEKAVATSGNYEQYFEMDGVRYSHNIDPKTGYPVKAIKSVTVISPAAELSDALATAVTIKGVKRGLELINQLPDTHCIMVDGDNKVFHSNNIDFYVPA